MADDAPSGDGYDADLNAVLGDEIARLEPRALDLLRALIRTPSVSGDEGRHDQPGTVGGLLWEAIGAIGPVGRHADPVADDR